MAERHPEITSDELDAIGVSAETEGVESALGMGRVSGLGSAVALAAGFTTSVEALVRPVQSSTRSQSTRKKRGKRNSRAA